MHFRAKRGTRDTSTKAPKTLAQSDSPPDLSVDLITALTMGRVDDARRALAAGADPRHPHANFGTPLILAARSGELDCVELLLPLSEPKAVDERGWSALTWAVYMKHERVIRRMLRVRATGPSPPPLVDTDVGVVRESDSLLDLALRGLREALEDARECANPSSPDVGSHHTARLALVRSRRVVQLLTNALAPERVDRAFEKAWRLAIRCWDLPDGMEDEGWWRTADELAFCVSEAAFTEAWAALRGPSSRARSKGWTPRLAARAERLAIASVASVGRSDTAASLRAATRRARL